MTSSFVRGGFVVSASSIRTQFVVGSKSVRRQCVAIRSLFAGRSQLIRGVFIATAS